MLVVLNLIILADEILHAVFWNWIYLCFRKISLVFFFRSTSAWSVFISKLLNLISKFWYVPCGVVIISCQFGIISLFLCWKCDNITSTYNLIVIAEQYFYCLIILINLLFQLIFYLFSLFWYICFLIYQSLLIIF